MQDGLTLQNGSSMWIAMAIMGAIAAAAFMAGIAFTWMRRDKARSAILAQTETLGWPPKVQD
jgi:phosphate/sulfate permease